MKRNLGPLPHGVTLLDLIECREMQAEAQQEFELEQREQWQASQAAQPSYREQYQ